MAQRVRTERKGGAWTDRRAVQCQPIVEDPGWIVRRQQWRKDCDEQEQEHDCRADQGRLVAAKAYPDEGPLGADLDRRFFQRRAVGQRIDSLKLSVQEAPPGFLKP